MEEQLNVLEEFKQKGNKAADGIAREAIRNKEVLDAVFTGVVSPNKRIKNAAGKTLMLVGEAAPEKLYPWFDLFLDLMDGEDTILRWIVVDIIGNLAPVDSENRINKDILKELFALLHDDSMVAAGHAIDSLGRIALHKPKFRKQITSELLKIEEIDRNEECRNIHIGQTLLAFAEYASTIKDREPVLAFARRALNNKRNSTCKKAESLLKSVEEMS